MKTVNIEWCTDDVKGQLPDGVELTEGQLYDILLGIVADHDATIGINWDVIDYHIDEYLTELNN